MVTRDTLIDRLWAKIGSTEPGGCRLWQAGVSRGGRREVDYGAIWWKDTAGREKIWRAHRLVLILKTAPTELPQGIGETWADWLHRADLHYRHYEASHTCDVSLCCSAHHLEWQDHETNVKDQRARRHAAQESAAA